MEAAWPEWRSGLIRRAGKEHQKARAAFAKAAAALREAAQAYDQVLRLDEAVLEHNETLAQQVQQEERFGLLWYAGTHGAGRPLQGAAVRYDAQGRPLETRGLKDILRGLDEALQKTDFAAAAWLPPGDPRREEILAVRPRADEAWVRRALWLAGEACPVCRRLDEDLIVVDVGDRLMLAHRWCFEKLKARDSCAAVLT
jgi:hypothetical protein